jgi:lipopolysaccharide transport system permease protein
VCWSWLLLPLTLAPLVLFSAGVAFFTSSLGVYFRDLQYLIGILLQMLFFLSPVFYRLGNLPLHYQRLLRFNPLVWFIETNRKVLFYQLLPEYSSLPSSSDYLMCCFLSVTALALGWLWFRQTKRGFSDVL